MHKFKLVLLVLVMTYFGFQGGYKAHSQDAAIKASTIEVDTINQIDLLAELEGAGGSVADMAFNPDSNLIAVTSREGLLLWDLQQQEAKWRIPIQLGAKVSFSSDGDMLVAASYPSVYLWSSLEASESWVELKKSDGQSVGAVGDVRFSDNNSEVVAILVQNRGIYRWQTDTKEIVFEQYSAAIDESNMVSDAILSDDAQTGAVDTNPEKLEILNTIQGDLLSTPVISNSLGSDLGVKMLIFSPSEELVMNVQSPAHSLNSSIVFLSLEGEINKQVTVKYEAIWVVGKFNPDGTLFAVANEVDDKIHFFETTNMEEIASIDTQVDSVTSLAFSPDGTLLASSGTDGTVRLWGVPAE